VDLVDVEGDDGVVGARTYSLDKPHGNKDGGIGCADEDEGREEGDEVGKEDAVPE
jgi:hypothetical protein